MCGIAGYLNTNGAPASPVVLKEMTDVIAHRGPDGEGQWVDSGIALGHRRLAIIDLSSAGQQPMQSVDGRYVMTYNGEVYNFKELRVELVSKGYLFHSETDSEVVLNAFAEWGVACLSRFNGMFSFAIWDRKEHQLTVARDRYGIKPLYWSMAGNTYLFGSEIKAILCHPCVHAKMDLPGLLEYCTFQNFFTDKTLFEGVHLLPAGCYSVIKQSAGATPETTRYWDYCFEEPENPKSEAEYMEELDHLFQQAVSRQLVSDVDVGAYLSGGMDSGSITAIASKQIPFMRTFTCGFDLSSASGIEMSFDERAAAERMSYLFKTEHYEMVLKAGDMERCMPAIAHHLEEPRVGQSYPNYYISGLAGKFNKVMLAGTGGDELFGGYPWRYYRAVQNDDFEHYIEKYYRYWQRLIPNRIIKKAFAPVWDDVKDVSTQDIFRDVFSTHAENLTRPEDYVNHSLYFEAKTFLHGLFVVEDKLGMAHSLETRFPFMDNDLVEFAMKLPVRHKLGNLGEVLKIDENEAGAKTSQYFQKTNDGKLLLRKVMKRHVDEKVTEREKQGFSAPDASWFKGESMNFVQRLIGDKKARIWNFMDFTVMNQLVNEHLEGQKNHRLLIWSLLNIEVFLEKNNNLFQNSLPVHNVEVMPSMGHRKIS